MNIDRKLFNSIQDKLDINVVAIDEDDVMNILEELINMIDSLEDKIKDLEQNIEDNYKPISYAEQIGYSERDFV